MLPERDIHLLVTVLALLTRANSGLSNPVKGGSAAWMKSPIVCHVDDLSAE
jgi:hypothetical protein